MSRIRKPVSESHIPLADIGDLSASDLLAIDGPKFITSDSKRGVRTYAVLISHDKWKTMNRRLPDVNPHKAEVFFVGEQAYLTIPVERDAYKCWRPLPETGLTIITEKSSGKKATR